MIEKPTTSRASSPCRACMILVPAHPIPSMPISLPIPIHPSHNTFTSLISSSSSQSRPSSPPAATHTWSTGRPRSAEPVIPHRQHKIPLTPPSPLPSLSPLANTNKPKLREGEQAKSQTTKKIKNNYAVPTPLPPPPPKRPKPLASHPKKNNQPNANQKEILEEEGRKTPQATIATPEQIRCNNARKCPRSASRSTPCSPAARRCRCRRPRGCFRGRSRRAWVSVPFISHTILS